jgi:hypothetical protein
MRIALLISAAIRGAGEAQTVGWLKENVYVHLHNLGVTIVRYIRYYRFNTFHLW